MLQTDRLVLRPIVPDDIDHIFSGLSHPEVIQYYGFQCEDYEDARKQMQWYTQLEQTGSGKWWAIANRKSEEFLGAAGFNNMHRNTHKAQIGFWLLRAAWGHGYMKEALPAVILCGFQELDLITIEAEVESNNIPSKQILKKSGFTHDRTEASAEIKDGRLIDLEYWLRRKSKV